MKKVFTTETHPTTTSFYQGMAGEGEAGGGFL